MVGTTSEMYRLKPLVGMEAPPTSKSEMYQMKRLFTSGLVPRGDSTSSIVKNESSIPSAEELANEDVLFKDLNEKEVKVLKDLRNDQLTMLSTLDQLRDQVEALKRQVGVDQLPKDVVDAIEASLAASSTSGVTSGAPPSLEDAVIRDIVVCAHPDRPPLAVFVYFEMLKQFFKVTGSVHVHSSVSAVPKSLSDSFGANGSSFSSGIARGVASRAAYDLAMTLIWKDVAHGSEMMVAPHRQARIRGEAAICRYLARICQPYDAEGCDALRATEIDTWVDAAKSTSEKEFCAHLKCLSSRLSGSRHWLVGESISLADVLNWAWLRSENYAKKQSLPPNVESWRKRCEDRPEFQMAARVASHSQKR